MQQRIVEIDFEPARRSALSPQIVQPLFVQADDVRMFFPEFRNRCFTAVFRPFAQDAGKPVFVPFSLVEPFLLSFRDFLRFFTGQPQRGLFRIDPLLQGAVFDSFLFPVEIVVSSVCFEPFLGEFAGAVEQIEQVGIVTDYDQRSLAGADVVVKPVAARAVEVVRGFVEQYDGRSVDRQSSQRKSRFLPAAQRIGRCG